jgi:hypothetical protein
MYVVFEKLKPQGTESTQQHKTAGNLKHATTQEHALKTLETQSTKQHKDTQGNHEGRRALAEQVVRPHSRPSK